MKIRTERYLEDFFKRKAELTYLGAAVRDAVDMVVSAVKHGNKLLACGNGGSASDCEHICGELMKSFLLKRKLSEEFRRTLDGIFGAEEGKKLSDGLQQGIPCIPLVSFSSLMTAFSNDCNSEMVFAQQVNVLGSQGDVLLAISTSGNSSNVLYAAEIAKAKGMPIIAFTGRDGGRLKSHADILLNAPADQVYLIQEYHEPLYHVICLCIESEMFES